MIKNASAHATEEERVDALVSLSLSVPISILLYLSLITLDDGGSGLWLAAGCGAVVVTPHTEPSMARQGSAGAPRRARSSLVVLTVPQSKTLALAFLVFYRGSRISINFMNER